MELYEHQKRILEKNPSKYLISHGTGTGKTITGLALSSKNNVDALIIVPKALKAGWARACKSFPNQNHFIISKEEFRRDWEKLPRYNAIICDEMHVMGNLKSQLSKALIKYTRKHNPTFIWGLTATPYRSSAMDIFSLATHLGYKWNYWSFFQRFFSMVRMGQRMVPVQKKGIEKELAEIVKSIGDTCTLEDCADVPEQTFETIFFESTPEQQKAIKNIDDSSAIARWTRTHGLLQGIKIGDEYTQDEYFECLKNDYIASLSEENHKMVVVCRYNLQIKMLEELLKKEGRKVFILSGEVKDRDVVVQEIEHTERCVVLLQADCGIGFEIPSIPLMVFASLSFSFVSYEQCKGRILRINKLKKNVYLHLVVGGTIDEDIYDCIMAKKSFNIAIYSKTA